MFRKTLQPDMFALDDWSESTACSGRQHGSAGSGGEVRLSGAIVSPARNAQQALTPGSAVSAPAAARTMTATQLAEHRKFTVRHWHHLELLTKPMYRGANLRVRADAVSQAGGPSAPLFCPRHLRSALVRGVHCAGPMVLGPCSGALIVRDCSSLHLSAVCDRVYVQNCRNVVMFLNCRTAPVIGRNCQGVVLAPFNVFYDVRAFAGTPICRAWPPSWPTRE